MSIKKLESMVASLEKAKETIEKAEKAEQKGGYFGLGPTRNHLPKEVKVVEPIPKRKVGGKKSIESVDPPKRVSRRPPPKLVVPESESEYSSEEEEDEEDDEPSPPPPVRQRFAKSQPKQSKGQLSLEETGGKKTTAKHQPQKGVVPPHFQAWMELVASIRTKYPQLTYKEALVKAKQEKDKVSKKKSK